MPGDFVAQQVYHDHRSFVGVQMLRACLCLLNRWEFSNLSAPYWRWYHNDVSGAFVIIDKKRITLDPDRIFLIPPNTPFATKTDRPVTHLYLHFTLGLGRTPAAGRIFSHPITPVESTTIGALTQALTADPAKQQSSISFHSQILVNMALEAIPSDYWEDRTPDKRIEQALYRIHREAPRSVGNESLARELGMNVNAFTRLFKEALGHTPHQYLLWLRMDLACQLLQYGDDSIETVAEKTGFYDRFHFSRVFKQSFHQGPSAFRNKARNAAGTEMTPSRIK